jgi:basic amino acid/polyamine antiporter, APA family
MFSLPVENWYRLAIWLVIGLVIYFSYGIHHSRITRQGREVNAAVTLGQK